MGHSGFPRHQQLNESVSMLQSCQCNSIVIKKYELSWTKSHRVIIYLNGSQNAILSCQYDGDMYVLIYFSHLTILNVLHR